MWCVDKVSLWPLLSTGMKVFSLLISCIRTERVSRVDHMASDNILFDSWAP